MDRPEVIAELGSGHGGDLTHARELVAAAAESGADCAKFQLIIADEIIHPCTGAVELPGGAVSLYDRFKQLEQPLWFYQECAAACERHHIAFLCTVFGPKSLALLSTVQPKRVKIASPELNHLPLLQAVAQRGITAILSTGVSRLGDIERAVETVGAERCELLHCVTAYPAPEHEYNLEVIGRLAVLFGVPVGVSDHSTDPRLVPGCAALCGARRIEKHFTLNRAGAGLDDAIALTPLEFGEMRAFVTDIHTAGGEAGRLLLEQTFGTARVSAALGDGVKRLAPSERANYGRSNRSLHALSALPAGTRLTDKNTALLRSEHNLRPGIAPQHLEEVMGARLALAVPAGEGIRWCDLLRRD